MDATDVGYTSSDPEDEITIFNSPSKDVVLPADVFDRAAGDGIWLGGFRRQRFEVDPSTTADQSQSRLLSLPPEILNNIYRKVCRGTKLEWTRRSGKKVEEKWTTTPWKLKRYKEGRGTKGMTEVLTIWEKDGKPGAPAFLLACKQMYEQASKVFFYTARFVFDTKVTFNLWLRRIRPENLWLYRRVFVVRRRMTQRRLQNAWLGV